MNRLSPDYKDAITEFITENDIRIDDMGLPGRPTNQLKRNGYTSLKDIMFLTHDDLASLPAMGSASVSSVIKYLDSYIESNKARIKAIHSGDRSALWDDESIKDRILDLYRDAKFHGLSMSDIEGRLGLPSDYSQERLKGVIGKLIAKGDLEYVDYRLYRKYPSFRECLDKYDLKSSRNKAITKTRLDGATLESIGDEYGVTRERIRQIVNNTYKDVQSKHLAATGLSLFDEDYYKYFYETYEFDRKDGSDWFGIDRSTWKYLDLVDVKRGKKSLEEAETDQNLDPGLRIKIKNYNNRGKIFVDGMWVRKKRPDLEEAVVRKYCTEDTTFTEFAEIYNDFVKEYGIEEDLMLKEELLRSRKSNMAMAKYLLWKQNEKLRYYDIDGRDYTELIDELGLQLLENIEISTLKLVEDHADVLRRYDIRDQYELHNLLRKIIPDGSMNGFHCGRMPMITVLYTKQHRWGYDDQRNKWVTCRTLAAYINLLIINNFDMDNIEAYSMAFANIKGEPKPDLWADQMVLKLDNQKGSDMLPYVWKGANMIPLYLDNGFMIDITPLVEGYKNLTGDNLVDEGLTNMILTYGPPSDEVKAFLKSLAKK